MIAARSGRTDITHVLLEEGSHADLDIQENTGGWAALHFSAERGDSATTYALIKAGANVHLKDRNGWIALEIAEVKFADREAKVIPEWSGYYMRDYEGVTDYAIVVELLKGNLLVSIPSPSPNAQYKSPATKSDVKGDKREIMLKKLFKKQISIKLLKLRHTHHLLLY
jgi:hypothetical protein